jgi:hypothetical protein
LNHQDFITRKGKEYISVTTALDIINDEQQNRLRGQMGNSEYNYISKVGVDNGTAFHELSILIDQEKHFDIDMDSLEDPVKCNIQGFQKWQVNNVVECKLIEKTLFHDKYLFHGTPDRVYKLINQDSYDLIDFKTGSNLNMKKIRWQLSGYKELLKANGIEVVNRIILHIRDGKIKPIPLDPRIHLSDFLSFLSAKDLYIKYHVDK